MGQATVFNNSPTQQAKKFEEQGFSWLHIVDLNGAFAGHPVNAAAIRNILSKTKLKVQLGGGIRSLDHISSWLDEGVARVILGTVAVRNPALVKEACRRYPDQIVVGIDAREGRVAVEGWARQTSLRVTTLAEKYEDAGVAAIVYTDIDRDGLLQGLNLDSTLELARSTQIPVIASGGLSGIDDVYSLIRPKFSIIEGAIVGRALYTGRLDAGEALAVAELRPEKIRRRSVQYMLRDLKFRRISSTGDDRYEVWQRGGEKIKLLNRDRLSYAYVYRVIKQAEEKIGSIQNAELKRLARRKVV